MSGEDKPGSLGKVRDEHVKDRRTDDRGDRSLGRRDRIGLKHNGEGPAEAGHFSSSAAVRDPFRLTDELVPNGTYTDRLGRRDDLIRAAQLFEQMIDMVEPCDASVSTVPAEALTSLLRQCEEISAPDAEAEVPMLIALPGLPILNPEWWQGAAGWDVVRLPDTSVTSDQPPELDQLEALRATRARVGQRLLAVMSADAVPTALPDTLRPLALVTCHPWHAFLAAGTNSGSLEVFSGRLLELLNRYSDLPLHRADDLADQPACREAWLCLVEGKAVSTSSDQRETNAGVPIDYLGGAPSYEVLCQQLGYDPAQVPETPTTLPSLATRPALSCNTALPQVGTPNAVVSWFIDRLATLPAAAPLVSRMRALIPSLDACLAMPAFPEALDQSAGQLRPEEAALLRLLAAAHFQRREDALQSMGLIAEALEGAPPNLPVLHQAGALLYLELNRPMQALEALAAPLTAPGLLDEGAASALQKAIFKDSPPDAGQHGQALLLAALSQNPPLSAPGGRQRVMIEIGTTRETVPGQGSTRQLALLCADLGIDFVTVDMDPANSRRAERMFRRLGLPFLAVTAKGEDYLAAFEGMVDYVFLDAYDFDHGKHSELRQSRYEQFLGSRINDADCHRMHLDCAQILAEKLSPEGLICFDDTWTDGAGAWTAKGTTAMPFLLENGFTLVEARNRAALLRRKG